MTPKSQWLTTEGLFLAHSCVLCRSTGGSTAIIILGQRKKEYGKDDTCFLILHLEATDILFLISLGHIQTQTQSFHMPRRKDSWDVAEYPDQHRSTPISIRTRWLVFMKTCYVFSCLRNVFFPKCAASLPASPSLPTPPITWKTPPDFKHMAQILHLFWSFLWPLSTQKTILLPYASIALSV